MQFFNTYAKREERDPAPSLTDLVYFTGIAACDPIRYLII